MRLQEIYDGGKSDTPKISFEFFPPKNKDDIESKFFDEVKKLLKFKPVLISITSSACGNKDINSKATLDFIIENTDVNIMPHLTCICASEDSIKQKLDYIKSLNCKNILALRGDEPEDIDVCYRDFRYANDLIKYIKQQTDFSIAAAGYPEGHIDCMNIDLDIENLKRKIDSGANTIFTQLFFDNNKFYKYLEKLDNEGINVPIVAGIMPVISYSQIEKMTSLANITIPANLSENIEKYKDNSAEIKKFGIDFGIKQCQNLLENGIKNLHFYTLNHHEATSTILENI